MSGCRVCYLIANKLPQSVITCIVFFIPKSTHVFPTSTYVRPSLHSWLPSRRQTSVYPDICVSLAAQAPHGGARSPTQPHAHSCPPRADSLPCTRNSLFFPGFAMMQPVALCTRPARESSQHSSQNHAALGVGETCLQGQTLKSSVSAEDLRRKQDEVQVFVPRSDVCVCVS